MTKTKRVLSRIPKTIAALLPGMVMHTIFIRGFKSPFLRNGILSVPIPSCTMYSASCISTVGSENTQIM